MGEAWTFPAAKEQVVTGFSSYALLAPGRYHFGINEKEDTFSKAGDPMLKLGLTVLEGPTNPGGMNHYVVKVDAPSEDTPNNKKAQFGLMLHFLHAVKVWDPETDTEVNFDTDDLIGRDFWAEVINEPYTRKDGSEGTSHSISKVYSDEELAAEGEAPAAEQSQTEEVPAEETSAEEEAPAKPKPAPKPLPKPAPKAAPKPAPKTAPKPAPKPLPKPAPKRRF